jgi:purine-binding chemotaxis protein CheW
VIQLAPKTIVGLFNMRGQVVTLFNLARILEYEEKEPSEKKTCIILKAQPNNLNQIGFLIDKTEDVFDLDEELCEPPPANSAFKEHKYVKKVAKLEKELLLLIENQGIFGNEF